MNFSQARPWCYVQDQLCGCEGGVKSHGRNCGMKPLSSKCLHYRGIFVVFWKHVNTTTHLPCQVAFSVMPQVWAYIKYHLNQVKQLSCNTLFSFSLLSTHIHAYVLLCWSVLKLVLFTLSDVQCAHNCGKYKMGAEQMWLLSRFRQGLFTLHIVFLYKRRPTFHPAERGPSPPSVLLQSAT